MISIGAKFKSVISAATLSSFMLLISITAFGLIKLDASEFLIHLAWHTILAIDTLIALLVISPLAYWATTKVSASAVRLKKALAPVLVFFLLYFIALFMLNASGIIWVPSMLLLNVFLIKSFVTRNGGAWDANNYKQRDCRTLRARQPLL